MPYHPTKSTWLNPNIEYLFNCEIIEYDMHNAGFSLIKFYKLIPDDEIKKLDRMEKTELLITIGKLQINNKELSKALSDKFTEMRTLFIAANSLTDNDIISVKKDAIYTTRVCTKTKFGKIEFLPKHHYSSYLRLTDNMNIELYYADGIIDIKGIGEHAINRHRLYLITFLQKIFLSIEQKDIGVKRFIRTFCDSYKRAEVDELYYLEFNNLSKEINPLYNYRKVLIPIVQIILREFM